MKINELNNSNSENVQRIVSCVQKIVRLIIDGRHESGQSQDEVAKWIGVDRRKIIAFESLENVDIELLCILCDKFSVELKLSFTQF